MHAGIFSVRAVSGFFALSLALLLASCGGGGGGGGSAPAPTYTIGGTVTGLAGTAPNLVLQNNLGNNLAVSKNGAFTFSTPLASGAAYNVTVLTKPDNPPQGCTVTNGAGTVGSANVTNIAIACVSDASTIGGTVFVTGGGPLGAGLVLQDNSGDNLAVSAAGTFTFSTPIAINSTYDVTVHTQPSNPTQTCTVTNGSGTVPINDVTDVTVTCTTNTYTIGGTVTGWVGGTPLRLRNNNNVADEIAISSTGTVPFTFSTPIASGGSYQVTVSAQPTGLSQTCTVFGGGPATVGNANVTNVAVICAVNTYTIGGTVNGLLGTGLKLRNNNNPSDEITIPKTGPFSFTFATAIASGANYEVTVSSQPGNPSQTCTVSNGGPFIVGSANVSNVAVNCTTNTYTIGGTVSGLAGAGLVLRNNGGDDKTISGTGTVPFTFTTQIASGANYAVTVLTQPGGPTQNCTVSSGTGTVGGANVTTVAINCTTNTYTIGGTITGLAGTGLVLRNNGGDDKTILGSGTVPFTFTTQIASGANYAVTVLTQPGGPTQNCTVSSGTGTVGGANVTTVAINCTTNGYTIGGTVAGLAGSGLKLRNNNNPADEITIQKTGPYSFTFGTQIESGQNYSVSVSAQPTSLSQSCTVSGGSSGAGSGTVTNANITDISISCTTNTFTVGGTVSGYNNFGGGGPTLRLTTQSGTTDVTVSGNQSFTFPAILDGTAYDVTVFSQPVQQVCTFGSNNSTHSGGTLAGVNVTDIAVKCATNTYTVGGTISIVGGGTLGTGLQLRNSFDLGGVNTSDLTVSASATAFTFAAQVAYNSTYSVAVLQNPSNPTQTCTVGGGDSGTGSGTVQSTVTSITVTCTTNTYNIGVTVTGLSTAGTTTGVVLQDNGADNKTFTTNSTSNFATKIASGATYNVTVLTQPTEPSQTCTVTAPTGTVAGADVSISVSCTTNTYNIGVTVTGLSTAGTTTGVVLQDNGADNKTFTTNSTSNFATKIASGATYNVTVLTQPTEPSQTCTVTAPTGTVAGADVSISVSCTTNTYNIGVTVIGLSTAGTTTGVVLQDNGADNKTFTTNSTSNFTTKIASGATYNVTVLTQPTNPSQTCTVTAPTGTVAGVDVNVSVSCTTNTYTIGGTVSVDGGGSLGATLVLQNNGGDNKTITAAGSYQFAASVASGLTYNVTILTQPSVPVQACTIVNGAGTVGGAPVTNVSVVCAIPTARFAYVPNFGDNTVSIYAVNAATGQLRHRGYVPAGTGPVAVSIDPSGKFVYVANETSGTVSAYSINAATGALTSAGAALAGISPESIVVEPSGHFVYVANAGPGNQTGTVSAYSINSGSGALAAIDADAVTGGVQTSIPAGTNPTSLAVDPLGRFVFVANGNSNNISVFSINAVSGALTPVGTPFAAGLKPVWITVDPAGKFVYATNFNSNPGTVSAYRIDATLGLIPITPDVTTGTGPRSIAIDPSGKFAYVVNQNGGTTGSVSAFNIDSVTGALSTTGTVDVLTGNLPVGITIDPFSKLVYVENVGSNEISAFSINGTTGGLTALPKIIGREKVQSMAMTKGAPLIYTPKFAYVANSGSNNVSAYTITTGTGVLAAVGSPAVAGTTPKSVSVDPFGRFAYVANAGGNVSAYTINATSGALTHVGTDIAAGTSPASVSVDVSGRFAYVANAGDGSSPSTVSAFTIDSGSGALSSIGTAPAGTGPASVAIEPSGRFAYVANFNSNDISAYSIDVLTGALTQIDADPVTTPLAIDNIAAGTGPQSVSVHPSGTFAYVPNAGGTISVYRIDPTNGALISIGSLAVGTNPASIAFDSAGKFAYVARKGDALVSVYLIDPVTGGLSFVGTIGTGTNPASVTVDASGQFAYVANSGSANVSAYTVNSGTGALGAISGSPFGAGSTPSSVTTTGTIQ